MADPYGGTDELRCAACIISGAPISPSSSAALSASVVPAHEANLDEAPAARHLGLDNPQACLADRRERLLAEDRLACLDRRQDMLFVRRAPGGDENRVDVVVPDEVPARLVHGRARQARGNALCAGRVDVGNRYDRSAGENPGNPPDTSWPIMPAPMTPTRTIIYRSPPVRPAHCSMGLVLCQSPEADR